MHGSCCHWSIKGHWLAVLEIDTQMSLLQKGALLGMGNILWRILSIAA